MTGGYPTASRADRFLRCPASEALPHVDEQGEAASRGIAIHAFLEDCSKVGREAALAKMKGELLELCSALDLEELPVNPAQYTPEGQLGWDPQTGDAVHLAYSDLTPKALEILRMGYFTGRADVIGVSQDHTGFVGDYKTGKHGVQAGESWQLRSLAVMLRRAYKLESVTVQLIYISPDATVFKSTARFDAEQLDGFEAELKRAFERIQAARDEVAAGRTPKVYMGDHCAYCPAYQACPGKQGLARALVLTPETVAAEVRAGLTSPETVGVAHAKLRMVEALVYALRRAVDDAAREYGGALLPSGKLYGPNPYQHPILDGAASWGILEGRYGVLARDAVTVEATKTGVKRMAKTVGETQGRPAAEVEREALALLEEAGALTYETRVKMGERKR